LGDPLQQALAEVEAAGFPERQVQLMYLGSEAELAHAAGLRDLRVRANSQRWVGVQTVASWRDADCTFEPTRVWIDGEAWLNPYSPRQIARRSAPGTQVSWPARLADRANRLDWASAGFVRTGSGWSLQRKTLRRDAQQAALDPPLVRTMHIVGAGLAGHALVARMIDCKAPGVDLQWWDLEDSDPWAGSRQPALLEHPHLSIDNNLMAQLCRAAQRALRHLPLEGAIRQGRLQQAQSAQQAAQWKSGVRSLGPLEEACEVHWLEPLQARAVSGWPAPWGALWWPNALRIDPNEWFAAIQRRAGVQPVPISRTALERAISQPADAHQWVIALGTRSFSLGPLKRLGAAAGGHLLAGASTSFDEPVEGLPSSALGGLGSISKLAGRVLVGASYCEPSQCEGLDHAGGNAQRFEAMTGLQPVGAPESFVGARLAVRDHLPLIGEIRELRSAGSVVALCGLGSRGVLWSALGAEEITARALGWSSALAPRLQQAISAQRFLGEGPRVALQ
jgi:hypothetical protein